MYLVAQDKYSTTKLVLLCTGHSTSNMDFEKSVRLGTNGEQWKHKSSVRFFPLLQFGKQRFQNYCGFKVYWSGVFIVEFSLF